MIKIMLVATSANPNFKDFKSMWNECPCLKSVGELKMVFGTENGISEPNSNFGQNSLYIHFALLTLWKS